MLYLNDYFNNDLSKKPQDLELWIAKTDKTIIGKLHSAYNIQNNLKLGNVCELTFSLPYIISQRTQLTRNPMIDLIRERYLIKAVSGSQVIWYVICKVTDADNGNELSKKIDAYSLEYELKDKIVRSFQYDSLNLQQCLNGGTITLGTTTQVVPSVLSDTLWSLGYIDADYLTTYRSFNISSTTLLDYIIQVANTFNALIVYDTVNRQVNFLNPLKQGIDRGLRIFYGKYLQDISSEIDSEEMCTRLKAFGQNSLTISGVNPTGQDYLDDLTYFIYPYQEDSNGNVTQHSHYLSDSLCHAELAYMKLVQSYVDQFKNLVTQLTSLQNTLTLQQNDLTSMQTQLNIYQDQLATANATGGATGTILTNIANQKATISNQQAQIDTTNASIASLIVTITVNTGATASGNIQLAFDTNTAINVAVTSGDTANTVASKINTQLNSLYPTYKATVSNNVVTVTYFTSESYKNAVVTFTDTGSTNVTVINSIADSGNENQASTIGFNLEMSNNFTSDQLQERNLYIVEREWSDSNYSDAQALYDQAIIQFNLLKQPKMTISVDLVNFLQIVEAQRDWDKLNLGDIVTIVYDRMNIDIQAKIIEANLDYEKGTLKLTLANTKDISDDGRKLSLLLNNASYSSTTVDMNQYKWGMVTAVKSQVEQIIDNTWDAIKRGITAGVNNSVAIDKRGITISDPTNPNVYLVANAGVLAITNDGGNTWKNAITSTGIVGERIYGKILAGVNLIIDASDSTGTHTLIVDSTGVKISGSTLTVTSGSNGVAIDPTNGITVTTSNNLSQITLNSAIGIAIAKNTGSTSNPVWSNQFYADTNGNLYITGSINCSDLKILGTDVLMQLNGLSYLNGAYFQNIDAGIIISGTLDTKKVTIAGSGTTIDSTGLHSDGNKFVIDTSGNATLKVAGTTLDATNGLSSTGNKFVIDANGNPTMTGGIVRTDVAGKNRVELSGTAIKAFNSSDQLTGFVMDVSSIATNGIADVSFYHNGTKLAQMFDANTYYSLRPTSSATLLAIGDPTKTVSTQADGNWLFPNGFTLPDSTNATKFSLSLTGSSNYPIMKWGNGTGQGDNNKGLIYKDDTSFYYGYNQSNGDMHSIIMKDDGTLSINHSTGSHILFDASGNITIHSVGTVSLTGTQINLN